MSDAAVHAEEARRVLAFVAIVGMVHLLAAIVLVRRYLVRPPVLLRAWSRTVLCLAATGIACIVHGRFIEPRWIEVTETRIPTARLPAGHRGVRLVHLSDIHCDPEPLVEERLPAIVAALRPDLIVFTGDAANSDEGVPVFRRCLAEIAKLAPTFAVKGNWDLSSLPELDRFRGTGATELEGTSAAVTVEGATVHVCGAAVNRAEGLEDALAALPATGVAIVLHHFPSPDLVSPRSAGRIDAFLAGHVHGGQVALPFYGALLTLSKFGKRFERGFYPNADGFGFPMYVSRGIGMEGGSAPRVRFCSRPEVALIELVPAAR